MTDSCRVCPICTRPRVNPDREDGPVLLWLRSPVWERNLHGDERGGGLGDGWPLRLRAVFSRL